MKLVLKDIKWSIWKSLASRRKGVWQFILRRFISADTVNLDLKIGEWEYYRRSFKGEQKIDFSKDYWIELQSYHTKWESFVESFIDDETLNAIHPRENDYLLLSVEQGIVSYRFEEGNWQLVFKNEELTFWSHWLAYCGVLKEN